MTNYGSVTVIGAGLAGCEAAFYLAERGVNVTLYEMKPNKKSPAHKSDLFAELVCSNSLKSNDVYANACGLLKEEMRLLDSLVIEAAAKTRVPAGNALAVDRDKFSAIITEEIKTNKNIKENIAIVGLLYAIGVFSGIVLQLIGIV